MGTIDQLTMGQGKQVLAGPRSFPAFELRRIAHRHEPAIAARAGVVAGQGRLGSPADNPGLSDVNAILPDHRAALKPVRRPQGHTPAV